MSTLMKRATIYLEPEIHKALHIKAVETSTSISNLVNEAMKQILAEDLEDLYDIKAREKESLISFESVLKELKKHGKI